MSGVKIAIKRFIQNKNTVTIFLLIIGLAILYWAYWWRIDKAIEPISVPYAKVDIEPRTLITQDMIGVRSVAGKTVTQGKVIMDTSLIIDKYCNYNIEIPADSLFFEGSLVAWEDLPSSLYEDIPDGNTIVALPVTMDSTYGNSIFEGNYIDLYYSGSTDQGQIMVGKFIESIKILAVTDSSFNNIFEKTKDVSQPYYLIFSVPEDMHLLLKKAMLSNGEIFPVPRNANYSNNPIPTRVSSSWLEKFILDKTVNVALEDSSLIDIEPTVQGGE